MTTVLLMLMTCVGYDITKWFIAAIAAKEDGRQLPWNKKKEDDT